MILGACNGMESIQMVRMALDAATEAVNKLGDIKAKDQQLRDLSSVYDRLLVIKQTLSDVMSRSEVRA